MQARSHLERRRRVAVLLLVAELLKQRVRHVRELHFDRVTDTHASNQRRIHTRVRSAHELSHNGQIHASNSRFLDFLDRSSSSRRRRERRDDSCDEERELEEALHGVRESLVAWSEGGIRELPSARTTKTKRPALVLWRRCGDSCRDCRRSLARISWFVA